MENKLIDEPFSKKEMILNSQSLNNLDSFLRWNLIIGIVNGVFSLLLIIVSLFGAFEEGLIGSKSGSKLGDFGVALIFLFLVLGLYFVVKTYFRIKIYYKMRQTKGEKTSFMFSNTIIDLKNNLIFSLFFGLFFVVIVFVLAFLAGASA